MRQKKPSARALHEVQLRALLRRPALCAVLALVVFAGVFAAQYMEKSLLSQQDALAQMQRDTRIHCLVTDAAGGSQQRLNLPGAMVHRLVDGDLAAWATEVQALSTRALVQPANSILHGILSFASDDSLSALVGASVTLYDGFSEADLAGTRAICLVSAAMPIERASDGNQYLTVQSNDETAFRLQVAGIVSGGAPEAVYVPLFMQPEGAELPFTADSCSFAVRDNARLDEARAALYEVFCLPRQGGGADGGFGLLIQDEIYLASKTELEEGLSLLRLLLPLLLAGMGAIGFWGASLAAHSRKQEFAVLRCMGVRRRAIFAQVLAEQLVLALPGLALALVLGWLLGGGVPAPALATAAGILAVFLLGAALAAAKISSVNTMFLMKTED